VIRSLRKGSTDIELWNKFGSVKVFAVETEVELMPDHAVFRTKLKPAGGNQRDDADYVFEKVDSQLTKISVRDQQIRKVASKFLNAYKQIKFLKLEIIYKKKYTFSVELKPLNDDGLEFTINT
jgi:hypothetical protein